MTTILVDIELLPPILQDVVELIGLHLTMKLVETHGGTRLFVPKREVADDHPLARLLGSEAAQKLVDAYGGAEHFDIPLALRALKAVRNAQIRAERPHSSLRLMALRYRTTERNIRLICGELVDDRQDRLF
ncbi:MAG TPA: hypothetical protein VFQ99_05760 [Gallionella sp.]|nr:hypothetical protein [Gallionella sp.]